MKKTPFALCLLLFTSLSLASCNEEIVGSLTFKPDGGTLFYTTMDDTTTHRELTSSDYSEKTEDSVTFKGVATSELPDVVKYLSAEKSGYKFMGWKQVLQNGNLASTYEDFSTGKKWNYSYATYQADYAKYVTVDFKALRSKGEITNEDGTTTTQWEVWEDGPYVSKDVYVSYSFNAKELQSIVDEFNTNLTNIPNGDGGFDYSEYGTFSSVCSKADESDDYTEVHSLEVKEDVLTYYLKYEENPSITYEYPEGCLETEGGEAISITSETKHAHGTVTSLSDEELQPTYMEPYIEGKRFLGWYFKEEDSSNDTKVDFSALEDGGKIELNGTYTAYPKFEDSIPVSIVVDDTLWTYAMPSLGIYFAGDTIAVSDLGTAPVAKQGNDVFDFWYYDVDDDGTFGDSDEKINEKSSLVIPKDVTSVSIRFQSKEKPMLYLDLTGVSEFWDTNALTATYGFSQSATDSNVYYLYVEKGTVLWNESSDDNILGRIKDAIVDTNRFVLSGYLLSSKSEVPYLMTDSSITVIPTYTRREKVNIHYATGVADDGSVTYGADGIVSSYYDVGFSSSFANGSKDLNGVTENDAFPSTETSATYVSYAQWGWKEGENGEERRSFTVPSYSSSSESLDIYAVMKKKVSLSLTLYESTTTMTLEGFVGDELPYAKIANTLGAKETVYVCTVSTQTVLGQQVTVATPITSIPTENGSYQVLTNTQYKSLLSSN